MAPELFCRLQRSKFSGSQEFVAKKSSEGVWRVS